MTFEGQTVCIFKMLSNVGEEKKCYNLHICTTMKNFREQYVKI